MVSIDGGPVDMFAKVPSTISPSPSRFSTASSPSVSGTDVSYPVPADGGAAPKPKTQEPPVYTNNRIYVSNIPFSFRDHDLVELFTPFGEVSSAMIVCNERGSKGFGFVTMDSVDSCERARRSLHGTKILGRTIEVRKATSPPKPRTVAVSRSPSLASPASLCSPSSSLPVGFGMGQQAVQQPAAMNINQQVLQQQINSLLSQNPSLLQNLLLSAASLQPSVSLVPSFVNMGSLMGGAQQSLGVSAYPLYQNPAAAAAARVSLTAVSPQSCGPAYGMMPAARQSFGTAGISQMQLQQPAMNNMGSFQLPYANLLLPTSSPSPQPSSSMNNSLLNSSMNTHSHLMQEQLVNFLNLDGTMNNSLYADSRNVSFMGSLNGSGSDGEEARNGRKRHAVDGRADLKIGRL